MTLRPPANDASTNFRRPRPAAAIYHLGHQRATSPPPAPTPTFYKIGADAGGGTSSASPRPGLPSARGTRYGCALRPVSRQRSQRADAGERLALRQRRMAGPGLDAPDRPASSVAGRPTRYYVKVIDGDQQDGHLRPGAVPGEHLHGAPRTGGTITTETESKQHRPGSKTKYLDEAWRRVQYLSHTTASLGLGDGCGHVQVHVLRPGDLVHPSTSIRHASSK